MSIFRRQYIRNIILVFTGITFLNMTFFLAEVSLLQSSETAQRIIQSIKKLKCDSGFEEERGSEESSEKGFSLKEMDLLSGNHSTHNSSLSVIVKQRNTILDELCLQPGYSETFSPPPEG